MAYYTWRAPYFGGIWSLADWYYSWTYVPKYLRCTPGVGYGPYTLPVTGKWNLDGYHLAAMLYPSYIVVDGVQWPARWWGDPEDSGGVVPDEGLVRVGLASAPDQSDRIAFSVWSFMAPTGVFGAYRMGLGKGVTPANRFYGAWNNYYADGLPVGSPFFTIPQLICQCEPLHPTRRSYQFTTGLPSENSSASLDLSYNPV